MKIVFIGGSMEPGRDGVGDYVRRICTAMLAAGVPVAAMGWNDKHCTAVFDGMQAAGEYELPVLRIPSILPDAERTRLGRDWIARIDPQWLSLQFVPFAFHPKGLKAGLSQQLLHMAGNRPWHLMVHELWVGMAREESVKLKCWGEVQRLLIRSLIKRLKPGVIHTQTALYQAQLKRMGFDASLLPLPSNIPVVSRSAVSKSVAGRNIIFVIFGSIHSGSPIVQFAEDAANYAERNGVTVLLTLIGRCGSLQQQWADAWRAIGLHVNELNEQEPAVVSKVLSGATAGICTTACVIAGKSGSFAAMREHGLPVICLSKPWTPRGISYSGTPDGMIVYDGRNFDACVAFDAPPPETEAVQVVSGELITRLLRRPEIYRDL